MTSTSIKEERVKRLYHQSWACIMIDDIIPIEHENTEEATKKSQNVMVKFFNFSGEQVDIN